MNSISILIAIIVCLLVLGVESWQRNIFRTRTFKSRGFTALHGINSDGEPTIITSQPWPGNAPGNLYVTEGSFNCDACLWMCPTVFGQKGIKVVVVKQPENDVELLQALRAKVACPVGTIKCYEPSPLEIIAAESFPVEIDKRLPGVFHAGYHSEESMGATPYFVHRGASQGNLMIDCPRFDEVLARNIERLGGLKYMILTSREVCGGHEMWKKRFPDLQRIIHSVDALGDALNCEIKLEGEGEWNPDDSFDIIHTPGYTAGSLCVLVRTGVENVLFSGHHLGYTATRGLEGFKRFNKGNVQVQYATMHLIASLDYDFTWVLPAHGRMLRFDSVEQKEELVTKAAENFEAEDERVGQYSVGFW